MNNNEKYDYVMALVEMFKDEPDTNGVVDVLGVYLAMLLAMQSEETRALLMTDFNKAVVTTANSDSMKALME